MAAAITQLTAGGSTTLSTTTSTASVTLSGAPVIFVWAASQGYTSAGATTVTWNGASESLTLHESESSANLSCCGVWYIDAPTPGTASFTATHNNMATRRHIAIYEVSGHDTSSSSAWRDAAVKTNTSSGTACELTITSATGDTPVCFVGLRNSSSAPTLSLNGSSTSVTAVLSGTTLRLYGMYGAGAASVTLGGTLSGNGDPALVGFNINSASGGGSSIAAISSYYHNQGLR